MNANAASAMNSYEAQDAWESESESSEESDALLSDNESYPTEQYTEMKEQMYQVKLAHLKRQLDLLQEGGLPEYVKKLRKLETMYKERLRVNEIIRELEIERVEQEYVHEKRAAAREFEEHKVYLREQLIAELEDKQKMIETERHNMELTGDSMELKPISTRKLRRRTNEPSGTGISGSNNDKRRKPMQTNLQLMLEEHDIIDDLRIVNKNKAFSLQKQTSTTNSGSNSGNGNTNNVPFLREIRIEDGKLFYEKRWFRRGQAVQVESVSGEKFPAMISAIGNEAIWVRKSSDNSKVRIYVTQLTKGKYVLKRRAV